MADYHSPTVVTPFIPEAEMTALERRVLSLVFDDEPAGDGQLYFPFLVRSERCDLDRRRRSACSSRRIAGRRQRNRRPCRLDAGAIRQGGRSRS